MKKPLIIPMISREDAAALGEIYYFTGKLCQNGHLSKRRVKTTTCHQCFLNNQRRCEGAKEYRRKLYEKNKEREKANMRARNRAARQADPIEVRQRERSYKQSNPEKWREYARQWAKKNPEKTKAWAVMSKHKRRARERALSDHFTVKDVVHLLADQGYKCRYCKIDVSSNWQIDHIMPLALGGTNNADNLQVLCKTCNTQKGAKHPAVYAGMIGLLYW